MKVKGKNVIFEYLRALMIIMVVDDHVTTRIGIFSSIFPYNSFYMPLFVFLSGYFYKKSGIVDNIIHKTRRLFIPYCVWNIIAIIIAIILDRIFNIDWIKFPDLNSLSIFLYHRPITSLNGASWFLIMLFWVSVIYNVIHCKFKDDKCTNLIFTIIHIIMGFVSVSFCIKGYSAMDSRLLFLFRTLFFLQFYHLGYMFKLYFEKILEKQRKIIICSLCILINVILILIFGDKINFSSTLYMEEFNYWYLPLITSITGIVFYYELMSFFSKKIGENKFISFISRNTLTIMQVHLLFVNIPNFYVYIKKLSMPESQLYSDFDIQNFRHSAWVRYSPNTRLIGFFLGVIGSFIVAFLIEKIKEKYKNKMV